MRSGVISATEISPASRAEGIHSLEVPRQTDQSPFALCARRSTQQELPELHDLLDQSKHRLDATLAQGVELATAARLQPMAHGLQRGRLAAQRRRLRKAFEQRGMVLLSAQGDQG